MTFRRFIKWKLAKKKFFRKNWMVKTLVVTVLLLFFLISCATPRTGGGPLKIFSKPSLPNIDWVMREVGYMSLTDDDYRALRGYVIKMESTVSKYKGQATIINE